MSLGREFTNHYLNQEPDTEEIEVEIATHNYQVKPKRRMEYALPDNVLAFPVVRPDSWSKMRMEAQ